MTGSAIARTARCESGARSTEELPFGKVADEILRVHRKVVDLAHADRQIAYRPLVRELDAMKRHRLHVAGGVRLRHHADADVAFDEPADGIEATKLHAQLQSATDAIGLLREEPL